MAANNGNHVNNLYVTSYSMMKWPLHCYDFNNSVIRFLFNLIRPLVHLLSTHMIKFLLIKSVEHRHPWKSDNRSASQKFPTFYGTHKLVIMFIRAGHWTISWVNLVHTFTPPFFKSRFSIILPFRSRSLYLSLAFEGFPIKTFKHFSSLPYLLISLHLILFDLIALMVGEEYKV